MIIKPISFTITLMLGFSLSNFSQSEPSTTEVDTLNRSHKNEHHQQLFYNTVECAAIIAVLEQEKKGKLTTGSKSFTWVGYTLGQASNYRSDGNLKEKTNAAYQQRVLTLFIDIKKQASLLKTLQQQLPQCIENAKTYDPKTQIHTLIERAKRQAQQ